MDSFPRLWPYLRPYRQRLCLSFVLGIVIAALWGANLTVAFPIIKVLLEHKSLHEYVNETIETAEQEETQLLASKNEMDRNLAAFDAAAVDKHSAEYVETLRKSARIQRDIATRQNTMYQFGWLKMSVMPWVPVDEFEAFCGLLALLIGATALKGVLMYWQDVEIGRVSEATVMGVRKELLRRVLDLDYQSLSLEGPSGLMSRFTYDAEQLSSGITTLGGRMIREPLKCLACMFVALYFNWRLTLLSLIFIPLLGLFLSRLGSMLKRASRRMMESMSQIYKVLEETVDGLKVVIGFHNAEHHRKLFDQQYAVYFKKAMKVVRIDGAARPLLELLGIAAMFMALVPGAYLVMRGKTDIWGVQLTSHVMDGAELGLLYAVLAGLLDPCRKLSSVFPRLKRSTAAIDRIFAMIDQQSLITSPADAEPMPRHHESIEFRDVSFRYLGKDQKTQRSLALEHVDLKVRFGEVVAIVGPNGCGKSTLVNLLPRFYDPDGGDIFIDERPMKDLPLEDLRRQVGVVMQDTVLFDGSVLDNIRYGSDSVSRAQLEEAARRAHVLPIIQSLPNGFETLIGGKGKELSGGQRQRIALARMILRDPAILVLDEATSAADAESEALIHLALKEFVKGRTTFLISHTISQSLLDFVTRIVVMEKGQIVASGSHEQLLETCPIYHRLYHSPSRQLGITAVKKAA
ncbi:ABC transporter ATP-binding protein [Planctomicrobium piriforme]|uniref:ATP-binding cassette, subfamily B, MsbA n=1 Tax=Planctomicrobium piriforme TaxID=1576369 RepID=A0A1I3DLZ5_9PLAN|nr:ABC transporter ATP-binding protein [Planctomicrobium piriforme]SFH87755.1 ATP-binding cassette, subfamily B, MsbA [Planctomicrobium piriforme]